MNEIIMSIYSFQLQSHAELSTQINQLQENIILLSNVVSITAGFSMLMFGIILWKLFKDEEKKDGI